MTDLLSKTDEEIEDRISRLQGLDHYLIDTRQRLVDLRQPMEKTMLNYLFPEGYNHHDPWHNLAMLMAYRDAMR